MGKKALSKLAVRQTVRIASNSIKSVAQIKELAGANTSLSTCNQGAVPKVGLATPLRRSSSFRFP